MKDNRLYLIHISESIDRIIEYTTDGRDAFMQSTLIQDGVVRNLQVMAESTKRLSDELKSSHPEVDWRGIADFRNVLVHDYLRIDLNLVWQAVERELPSVKAAIDAILKSNNDQN